MPTQAAIGLLAKGLQLLPASAHEPKNFSPRHEVIDEPCERHHILPLAPVPLVAHLPEPLRAKRPAKAVVPLSLLKFQGSCFSFQSTSWSHLHNQTASKVTCPIVRWRRACGFDKPVGIPYLTAKCARQRKVFEDLSCI